MSYGELNNASRIENYYRDLYTQCGKVLDFSIANQFSSRLADSHNHITDIGVWIKVLEARTEVFLLELALHEYQFAILSLCIGHYRQAFASLRLFMELALASVQFSANELQLREWIADRRDIQWSGLISSDEGVFSKRFAHAFFAEAEGYLNDYLENAKQVYRDCSEFVHGNYTTHSALPDKLEFSETVFSSWHDAAKKVRGVVLFALCLRYIRLLDGVALSQIELGVMDELGHISTIRAVFGGTTGV